jgi:hypothetical protein
MPRTYMALGRLTVEFVIKSLWVKVTDFGVTKEVFYTQRLASTEDGLEFQVGPVGSLLTQLAKSYLFNLTTHQLH